MDLSLIDQLGYIFVSIYNQFMPLILIFAMIGLTISIVPAARRFFGFIRN